MEAGNRGGMQNKALTRKGASSSDADYKTMLWGQGEKQQQCLGLVINNHPEAAFLSAQVGTYQHSDT